MTTASDLRLASGALLVLRDLGVRYRDRIALHPLSLVVEQGECVALLGSNGSGKTSLLKLLMGVQPPNHLVGSAAGREVGRAGGRTGPARLAMVFQHPFFLHLSVRRNLQLALYLQKVPRAEWAQRIDAALTLVGLTDAMGRSARALSGGQQQRLAFARAACLRPDVLFLDEPTASLDPSAKREVEQLIERFHQQGTTLVMSTHNLGQAKRLATRVVYMEAGRVLADRPVTDFFHSDDLPETVQHFLKGDVAWVL